jgi:hypothetical protein
MNMHHLSLTILLAMTMIGGISITINLQEPNDSLSRLIETTKALVKDNMVRSITIYGPEIKSRDHHNVVSALVRSHTLEEVHIVVGDGSCVNSGVIRALKWCSSLKRLTLRFRAFADISSEFENLYTYLPKLEYLKLESMNVLGHVSKNEDPSKFIDFDGTTFGIEHGSIRLFDKPHRDIVYRSLQGFRYVGEICLIRFFMTPAEVRYLDNVRWLTLNDFHNHCMGPALGDLSRTPRELPIQERIKMCSDTCSTQEYVANAIYESDDNDPDTIYKFVGQTNVMVYMYTDKQFVFDESCSYRVDGMRSDYSTIKQ